MFIKHLVRQFFDVLGYEIRRKSTSVLSKAPADAFATQQQLLQGKAKVVFDVGAHIGEITRIYRTLFPAATIHAFEPSPLSFQQLMNATQNDINIHAYQTALSDSAVETPFFANTNAYTNSLLQIDDRANNYWGEGRLQEQAKLFLKTQTLDSFCEQNGLSQIDLLKLDVQGAEWLVLNGATKLLSQQEISLIYMEIIVAPTYKDQRKMHEYMQFLDDNKYELVNIYNMIYSDEYLVQCDALFISSLFKYRRLGKE